MADYIDRDALYAEIEKVRRYKRAKVPKSNFIAGDVLRCIESAPVVDFATGNNVGSKWIPVEERLPEHDGKYIVARREGSSYSISVRKFRKEVPCWYTGYCGHWERRTNGITHWMPLPTPPVEDTYG